MSHEEIDEAFDALIAAADSPMWVVTTIADGRTAGCLVGFAGQVSITPRRFLVAVSKNNHTYRIARRAEYLAVHLLTGDNVELARLFGTTTGDSADKFARCAWSGGPHGLPILDGAAGWFAGRIIARSDLGDHVGHLLEPLSATAPPPTATRSALHLRAVAGLTPGHEA
ncbi:flavin reductase family protein [Nocardia cyriacigeorgica]|uniref:flavin reductase family protein n=1 Tax=Nocardia cyriacigeorgica TaxID=135487 RepID=UPI001894679B|nr:flavin reductase family protein [Nocardia cyriacigeorgica]MBF6414065.1 flavin reductase family protein [Nocardia cyriacigeorgica]